MTSNSASVSNDLTKKIYLAGGCFWGVEKLLSLIPGVVSTCSGYANGPTENPTYEEVCAGSGHAETVEVHYDPAVTNVATILDVFFSGIDPTSLNRQGPDQGVQYRSGIYYTDEADRVAIDLEMSSLRRHTDGTVVIEVEPLHNFAPAEDYHQDFLEKNPGRGCHISFAAFEKAKNATPQKRVERDDAKLRELLSPLQYEVAIHAATEPPFTGEYDGTFEPGLYVDVATGQPLFVSTEKFDSGCGWPAFARPISPDSVVEIQDRSHGMVRTEVRSSEAGIHLGHVFPDGPSEMGGLRYCINSASLRFVPRNEMEEEGYGDLVILVDENMPGGH